MLRHFSSPFTSAWEVIYKSNTSSSVSETLRSLFPQKDRDCTEDLNLSKLHLAVLCLSPSSVEEELLKNSIHINEGDVYGATALCWAAKMNNLKATKALLRAGADSNIPTVQGHCCLLEAAKGQNLAILKALLAAGALISTRDNIGRTALHCVGMRSGDPEIINTLVAAGIDINQPDTHGSPALNLSASVNNIRAMKSLLRYHPKIDVPDGDGDTAFLNACMGGHNEAIEILLQYRADYTRVDHTNNTALHKIASKGNLQTLKLLRSAKLRNIDTNWKNSDSKTAFEVAQRRHTKPDGFIELLLTLLFEIRMRSDYAAEHPKSSNDDYILQSERNASENRDNRDESEDCTINIPGTWPSD